MKLRILLIVVLLAGFCNGSPKAQTIVSGPMSSPNLVNIANSQSSGWTGTTPYTGTGGGYSGGSTPGYNATTNTIHFGYTQSTAAYTYAFSTALKNSGMTILGYNYSWDYLNQGQSIGTLTARVNFAGVDGSSLHTKNWTLGPTTDWTNVTGTETFANNGMAVSSIANFSLSFSGKDSRFWAGYYGPQVKNPSLSLNYTFDQCSTNPLSSPSCAGYADAVRAQACTANPLSDTSCPGYQAAKNAVCAANPLNDSTCPGYADAVRAQACTANPLSDQSCPGYAVAYKNQQCSISPLYDSTCPGYAAAYKTQQCTANPLYATDCPGYDQAYLNSQCIKDSLYSKQCTGYATAYAIKYLVPNIDSSAVNSSLSSTAATKASDPANTVSQPNATVSTTSATTSVSSDGTVSTGVSKTGNSAVDNAITPPITTSVSPASPNSVVQTAPPPAASPMAPAPQQAQNNGSKQDDKGGDKPQSNQQAQNGPGPNQSAPLGNQPQGNNAPQPTARQEIAAKREEQRKMDEMKQGKEMAENMKAATSMEQQRAAQGLVISAMAGYSPAFEMYKQSILFDAAGYRPYAIYGNQRTVDNRSAQRMFSGNDRLHSEMVDQQYNKEK